MAREYTTFKSWPDVLAHIDAGRPIFYHAPLDYRPVLVHARRGGLSYNRDHLRITPRTSDADPFWADAGHLERFRQETKKEQTP